MTDCSYCGFRFEIGVDRCPHCAQPGLFPNVQLAAHPDESAAVDKRYEEAITFLGAGNADVAGRLRDLPTRALLNRSPEETIRVAKANNEIYVPFYKATAAGLRVPQANKWDAWRRVTDMTLFPGFHEEIRFACLSTDMRGLWNYGHVSWMLAEPMIAHRASVFEENSAAWFRQNKEYLDDPSAIPKGRRATWERRGHMCVIKLARQLNASLTDDHLAQLLLVNGTTSDTDVFVEVHVYGPVSIHTLAKVAVNSSPFSPDDAMIKALKASLDRFNVPFELR